MIRSLMEKRATTEVVEAFNAKDFYNFLFDVDLKLFLQLQVQVVEIFSGRCRAAIVAT